VALALVLVFKATLDALVALYAIGVFTGFFMAGSGMVKHHLTAKGRHWRRGVVINGFSAFLAGVVVLIFAVAKFTQGAWIIVVVGPVLYFGLVRLHRQYDREEVLLETGAVKASEAPVLRRHVVVVADEEDAADDLKRLKPFIKEYQPVLIGAGGGADVLRKAGYRPQLIVGDPSTLSTEVLKSGAQVVLPADADGHAPGLERIQDLGVGAMTFPAAGSPADLALLLADHHGAALLVTAGHSANIETFFDRTRQHSNPSTFLTRLRVGEKVVDAKAVATLYHNRISAGAIALLIMTMLIAVIVALWVSRTDTLVLHWVVEYWNHFYLWLQHWVH